MKRQPRLAEVVGQPAIGLDERILHDVACIDPPSHAAVHPRRDHPPQRFPMTIEQAVDGRGVSPTGGVQ